MQLLFKSNYTAVRWQVDPPNRITVLTGYLSFRDRDDLWYLCFFVAFWRRCCVSEDFQTRVPGLKERLLFLTALMKSWAGLWLMLFHNLTSINQDLFGGWVFTCRAWSSRSRFVFVLLKSFCCTISRLRSLNPERNTIRYSSLTFVDRGICIWD